MKLNKRITTVLILGVVSIIDTVQAKNTPTKLIDERDDQTQYAPHVNDTYPNNVYFGDTHVHTSFSTDAGFFFQ